VVGLAAMAIGLILLLEGVPGLRLAADLAIEWAPLLLVALGLVGLFRALAPTAAWAGPVLLIAAGLTWLAFRIDLTNSLNVVKLLAAVLIASGTLLALMRPTPHERSGSRSAMALLLPGMLRLEDAPERIVARAVLGQLTVDLTPMATKEGNATEVDVRIFVGRVLLIVPKSWRVEAGRLHATYRIKLNGTVEISGATEAVNRTRVTGDATTVLCLHILGAVGSVDLVRSA
jgi:hypothetical protein